MRLDHTHDVTAKSWLESANLKDTPFPLQNLPFGVFRRTGTAEGFRGGVALGDQVIDLGALADAAALHGLAVEAARACAKPGLNQFFDMGPTAWRALRHTLFALFKADGRSQSSSQHRSQLDTPGIDVLEKCLVAQSDVEYCVPAQIGDYTDFYTSLDHARNIVKLIRPDAIVSPNFHWIPSAYHGRVSSIGVSGQQIRRPFGQRLKAGSQEPELQACGRLDYELELGIFVGTGNEQGTRIPVESAEDHVFGLCLLNDWSARDIQSWESAPLGPFLAKNFATTLSPWIVTMDALAPYRAPWTRSEGEPQPLPYLSSAGTYESGAMDIQLEVSLETRETRRNGMSPTRLSRTSFRHQYWTVAQMVAHHTIGGCNLRSGDLLGSGTISGPTHGEAGALIELTEAGRAPLKLPNGESRSFLEDGDIVVMTGWCERPGYARIGFGENRGEVTPAKWA
ncbi:fumarylacetoacetase [Paraburkholderia ginsengiterrae]|uniref:fumarylacetoacetase n=1 Tax=Paraburkholderia ginsengiterrae TaxID=1462993 RepID=A0A1A9N8G9_9BURK|nr:fumarylacetoacetase [Paraburkholderia ginsengiterrae]OAJ54972.1 fumarylacetoacetase [Paraburkholderia ginsengiterrae]OAJ61155.1 fumarylacetoacetase [Paraburkholderia ginsengiterrae]